MTDKKILKAALASTPDCLSAEQLEAITAEQSSQHPHLSSCARCQAELALLRSFESNQPLADEGAAVGWISSQLERRREEIRKPVGERRAASIDQDRPSWWERMFGGGRLGLAIPAVALVAVAVAGIFLLRSPHQPELQANLGSQPTVYRSQELRVTSPVGELDQLPSSFEWVADPSAAKYKIEVMEVDQNPLWTGESSANVIAVPPSLRAKIMPGKPILWRVTAVNARGEAVSASQIQRFELSRKRSDSSNSLPSRP